MSSEKKRSRGYVSSTLGFYYGTSYVSYVLSILISAFIVIAWFLVIGLSEIPLLVSWMVFNGIVLILLQPWLMRLSRSIWISWFVRYDPDWKEHHPDDVTERLNADQANNW